MAEQYDIKTRCPQCGWTVVRSEYHPVSYEESGCSVLLCIFDGTNEHIVRTCAACAYEFFQEPLSMKQVSVEVQSARIFPEEPTELW